MKHIEAVIFDWAGTTVDHGSLAPVRAITETFLRRGIRISDEDARRDMGIFKKDHIRRILALAQVRPADERDVEELFTDFSVLQMPILENYSQVIDGVAEVTERLRSRGLKIGSTTGYTRPMLDILTARAASRGYAPDLSLCPDDVAGGRPYPWMCLRIAIEFRLSSTSAAVKIGDTTSDIEEALNAGMWAVGVAATGNEVGLSTADLASLPEEDRRRRIQLARDRLLSAGAHYVVDSVAVCELTLGEIDDRLAAGERP